MGTRHDLIGWNVVLQEDIFWRGVEGFHKPINNFFAVFSFTSIVKLVLQGCDGRGFKRHSSNPSTLSCPPSTALSQWCFAWPSRWTTSPWRLASSNEPNRGRRSAFHWWWSPNRASTVTQWSCWTSSHSTHPSSLRTTTATPPVWATWRAWERKHACCLLAWHAATPTHSLFLKEQTRWVLAWCSQLRAENAASQAYCGCIATAVAVNTCICLPLRTSYRHALHFQQSRKRQISSRRAAMLGSFFIHLQAFWLMQLVILHKIIKPIISLSL